MLGVPFTIRAHSFDVLGDKTQRQDRARADQDAPSFFAQAAASSLFRGVLCFPFMRERLIAAGLPADRVHACNPVIDVERFRDRGPNGRAIMNVGAAIPKKNMGDFVALSRLLPEREFNLYALGYRSQDLEELNRTLAGRVNFVPPVDPEDMAPEYKKHAWLVYTASPEKATVGWPMALIEAMASGVGACMQDIRPDLKDYVGDAGVLFRSIPELVEPPQARPHRRRARARLRVGRAVRPAQAAAAADLALVSERAAVGDALNRDHGGSRTRCLPGPSPSSS
jgi:glycosyltransferase involved in cell wall biosynthesis